MKKILCLIVISLGLSLFSYPVLAAEEPIKIAGIYAQTGDAAGNYAGSMLGTRLAVDEINSQGGVLGRKLELLIIDNYSTATGSKVAADNAVKKDVLAIVGLAWSSHALVVAKVAQENRIPMITNIATHPDVTKVGKYIFRVCFIDPFQGKVMARFARDDLKAKTAVIMTNVSDDYSMKLSEEFRKGFQAVGGTILLKLDYLQGERDFKELLSQVKKLNPDALFLSGHDEGGLIAKQSQELGIKAVSIGGDGWEGPSFLEKGGKELKEGYYSSHWSAEIDNESVRNFLKQYQSYGVDASTALAYDAVFLLVDAIKRANSLEKDKIREALAQTKHFQGLTGDITMDENRNPIKSVVIIKIINGKPHYYKTVEPF